MEQHPVPQNVTTFQFRLVGDMTIKQFGYLAGGIILGYIGYKLPLPFFFTWPLAIASGLLGFGLAFVPIEERPMDVWIASFIKNVYNPTQWVWSHEARSGSAGQKEKKAAPAHATERPHITQRASPFFPLAVSLSAFMAYLVAPFTKTAPPHPTPPPLPPARPPQKTPPQGKTIVDGISSLSASQKSQARASDSIISMSYTSNLFDWIKSVFSSKPRPVSPSLSPGFSFSDALTKHAESPKKPQAPAPPPPPVPPQPVVAPPVPPAVHTPVQAPTHGRVVELQGQLSEALSQREKLERELIAIRQQMERQSKSAPTPTRPAGVTSSVTNAPAASVRVIAPGGATKAGLLRLTTFPNVVTGIVKDNYGNLLAGMLITVRDSDDVPLRALKTNKLGQFAASTPLPNNTYIVEIEDPKGGFTFDKAQISLNGTVAPPIEVTAKSQKQIERDKLAKEIFGNQPM